MTPGTSIIQTFSLCMQAQHLTLAVVLGYTRKFLQGIRQLLRRSSKPKVTGEIASKQKNVWKTVNERGSIPSSTKLVFQIAFDRHWSSEIFLEINVSVVLKFLLHFHW